MKRFVAVVFAGALGAASYADVVYVNDFSSRTSAGVVPSREWREAPYAVGKLVNDSYTDPFGEAVLQDNWIKGPNNCKGFAHVVDDNGNQEALLSYDTTPESAAHVIVKQRLGSTFLSGVVTAQCDFRPPKSWNQYTPRSVRLVLGDEAFFSPETGANDYMNYIAAGAGVSYDANAYKFYKFGTVTTSDAKQGVWYRVVLTANLATKKYDAAIYEMGAEHPALDAATPETPPAWSETGVNFYSEDKNVQAAGISSIALFGYGVGGSADSGERDSTALFDNIRVWHDGELCYENDFTTRRSRNLTAGATASATYPVPSTPATNVYSYGSATDLLAARDAQLPEQPVGVDGWRRLNKDLTAMLKRVEFHGDYAGEVSDSTTKSGWAGHTLGQSFAGGKVRMAADVRTTGLSDASDARVSIALGNNEMYNGNYNTYANGYAAMAGVSSDKQVVGGYTERKPVHFTRNNNSRTAVKSDVWVRQAQWMRLVIEADIDNQTYDFTIYRQGGSEEHPAYGAADGTVLHSVTGIPFANQVNSISSFALACYGATAYFDNICIWHTPNGGSIKLLYYDTFTERMVCGHSAEDALVGTIAKNPVGIDGWTRLGRNPGEIFLTSEGTIGFGQLPDTPAVYAVHDLGGVFKSGRLTTQFDMRAPTKYNASGRNAYVWLGGERLRDGSLNKDDDYLTWRACGAGFAGGTFAAFNGDENGGGSNVFESGVEPGHWYRFVMKADIAESKSEITVYDMGTERPVMNAARPATAVWTYSGLPFRRGINALGGLSCLAIQAAGTEYVSPFDSKEARLEIDNIRVTHSGGLIIVIK